MHGGAAALSWWRKGPMSRGRRTCGKRCIADRQLGPILHPHIHVYAHFLSFFFFFCKHNAPLPTHKPTHKPSRTAHLLDYNMLFVRQIRDCFHMPRIQVKKHPDKVMSILAK